MALAVHLPGGINGGQIHPERPGVIPGPFRQGIQFSQRLIHLPQPQPVFSRSNAEGVFRGNSATTFPSEAVVERFCRVSAVPEDRAGSWPAQRTARASRTVPARRWALRRRIARSRQSPGQLLLRIPAILLLLDPPNCQEEQSPAGPQDAGRSADLVSFVHFHGRIIAEGVGQKLSNGREMLRFFGGRSKAQNSGSTVESELSSLPCPHVARDDAE